MEAVATVLAASCFYGLLGWHAWSRRGCCARFWAIARERWSSSKKEEKADIASERVERQMDRFRIRSAEVLCEIFSVAVAMVLMVLLSGATSLSPATTRRLFVVAGITYPLCLAHRHDGPLKMTCGGAKCIYVALNSAMLLLGHLLVPSDTFFLYYEGSFRTLVRSCSGFLVLDVRLSTAMNTLWSIVLICQHLFAAPRELSEPCRLDFVIFEVVTLLGMQSFIAFADGFLRTHFRLGTSLETATNLQKAVRALLSVLCDAELQLTPELSIWDPSAKVVQLLAPQRRCGELHGAAFTDFVAAPDRERFQEFLTASAGSSVPTSLMLQLHDATGYAFPAEIFVARLPDLAEERPGSHLIGIKDCGQGGREAIEAVLPQGTTFGPGCPPKPASRAKSTVSSEGTSVDRRVAIALPELQAELRFDPLDPGMPIRELRASFRHGTDEATGEQMQPPSLDAWFYGSSCQKRLRDWVQENCNRFVGGTEPSGYMALSGPTVLRLSPQSDSTVLEAGATSIEFLFEGEEEEDEGEEDEEEGSLVGVIRMDAFRQLQRTGPRSDARSQRSQGSRRSARSRLSTTAAPAAPAVALGCIREAGSDSSRAGSNDGGSDC